MKLLHKYINQLIVVIASLQIVGGLSGLMLICSLLLNTGTVNGPILLIFFIGISLFVFSIYGGKRLFFDKNKNMAIILVIINQAFQLFQWSVLGSGLSYSSGCSFLIGVKGTLFKFSGDVIVSNFSMAIHSDSIFFLKMNLCSVLIIAILMFKYRLHPPNTD